MKKYIKNTILKMIVVLAALVCAWAVGGFNTYEAYAKDADGDYVVLIDPGHGGADPGAISSVTGDKESELNWNIAMALKAELQTYEGVKVYLSRGYGEYQSNAGRADTGKSVNADLNISVHNNSASSGSANGVICYGTVNSKYKDQMKTLCLAISKEINKLGINLYGGGYGARESSGTPGTDYYTFLGESAREGIPSIIIEHCYISNSSNAQFVHKYENQCKLGAADATAIANYLGLKKRTVEAGADITLTRTYSAYVNGGEGCTYSVSDDSVINVREDGLVTAKKAGTATVTCTAADGTVKNVTVTVPAVKLVAIGAGVVQNNYGGSYDAAGVVVKGIYSDGSATQITSGYTLGSAALVEMNNQGTANEQGVYDVSVTYGGLSCKMSYYYYKDASGISKHSLSNVKPTSGNKDVLVLPGVYTGGSGTIIETPVVVPTQPATQAPTVEPTEATTEPPTETESETPSESETEVVGGSETDAESFSETGAQDMTEDNADEKDKSKVDPVIVVCIVLLAILCIAGALVGYILYKRRR